MSGPLARNGKSVKKGDLDPEVIKPWVDGTINAERERGKTKTPPSWSPLNVPKELFKVRESAFRPECFSFGPFYMGKYKMYEDLKSRHLSPHFGGIFGDTDSPKRPEAVKNMIDLVRKAIECYDKTEKFEFNDRLLKTMVCDGLFIVDFMRLDKIEPVTNKEEQSEASHSISDPPIFERRWLLSALQRDLIKLQNQLPLSFLEKLFSMTTPENGGSSLQDLFVAFFRSVFSLDESIYKLVPENPTEYAHPLDLFHSLFVLTLTETETETEDQERKRTDYIIHMNHPKLVYSALYLEETGITIKKKNNSPLLDISFDSHKRVLQIPPLSINENMIVALLNFVAFEQGDQSQEPYFINYLMFLDGLINTTKDLEVLRKNRIINYPLGTEKEVVDFFNNFCKRTLHHFHGNYLFDVVQAINKYCDDFYDSKWWRLWLSELKTMRVKDPWVFFSLVVSIAALMLTMVQAVYAVVSYFRPN